jgi:hypothetical protein
MNRVSERRRPSSPRTSPTDWVWPRQRSGTTSRPPQLAEPRWRDVEAADGDDRPVIRSVLRHAEARVTGGDAHAGEPGSFEVRCCLLDRVDVKIHMQAVNRQEMLRDHLHAESSALVAERVAAARARCT